jgi:hypothetical protein
VTKASGQHFWFAARLRATEHCGLTRKRGRLALVTLHTSRKPYLLMMGETENPRNAKTALGLKQWTPEACVGQLRLTAATVDVGLPDMSVTQGVAAGAKTLLIGIAPPGFQPGDVPMIRAASYLITAIGVVVLAGSPAQAQAASNPSASTNTMADLLCRIAHICPDDNGIIEED